MPVPFLFRPSYQRLAKIVQDQRLWFKMHHDCNFRSKKFHHQIVYEASFHLSFHNLLHFWFHNEIGKRLWELTSDSYDLHDWSQILKSRIQKRVWWRNWGSTESRSQIWGIWIHRTPIQLWSIVHLDLEPQWEDANIYP